MQVGEFQVDSLCQIAPSPWNVAMVAVVFPQASFMLMRSYEHCTPQLQPTRHPSSYAAHYSSIGPSSADLHGGNKSGELPEERHSQRPCWVVVLRRKVNPVRPSTRGLHRDGTRAALNGPEVQNAPMEYDTLSRSRYETGTARRQTLRARRSWDLQMPKDRTS